MTLREDLDDITELAMDVKGIGGLDSRFAEFMRDHGQALVEAVRDQDRLDWICRNWVLVTKGRGMFGEFPLPYDASSTDLTKSIDTAMKDVASGGS
jgi:hypothetical protein